MSFDSSNMVSIDLKGNLLFSIAPDFTRQFMITSWNSGMRFFIKTLTGWEEEQIDTGLMLVCDENIGLQGEPISDFLKQLPNELIALAKPYRYRQFVILQLIAQEPKLLDIFKHSPNLFWMLIVEAGNQHWTQQDLIEILHNKRENIVQAIINIKCKKRVRFIHKLILNKYVLSEFDIVKKALLSDEIINGFDNRKSLHFFEIKIAMCLPYFIETPILKHELECNKTWISQRIKFTRYYNKILDIERMATSLSRTLPRKYKRNLTNYEDLERMHNSWIIRFNHSNTFIQHLLTISSQDENQQAFLARNLVARNLAASRLLPVEKICLPICPLGDSENFIQIKNNFELLIEGNDMSHCVGCYVNTALAGNGSYFYKVLAPERGTAYIRYIDDDCSLVDFKLSNNKQPAPSSYQALYNLIYELLM